MPAFFDGKLVFIHIPKCAGNSVYKSLCEYQLNHRPEMVGEIIGYRSHESYIEVQDWFIAKWGIEKWKQTTTISTIRNPVDRAVSWWRYKKKVNLQDFQRFHQHEQSGYFNAITAAQPYLTSGDYDMYHEKHHGCCHLTERGHVEAFSALSFHEYVSRMTVWRHNGCDYPECPYHAAPPQVCWLYGAHGSVRINELSLFLVERLDELERFLPEMPKIGNYNVGEKKRGEDCKDHLTTASLIRLNRFYAEDFELYKTLKDIPPDQRDPIRF